MYESTEAYLVIWNEHSQCAVGKSFGSKVLKIQNHGKYETSIQILTRTFSRRFSHPFCISSSYASVCNSHRPTNWKQLLNSFWHWRYAKCVKDQFSNSKGVVTGVGTYYSLFFQAQFERKHNNDITLRIYHASLLFVFSESFNFMSFSEAGNQTSGWDQVCQTVHAVYNILHTLFMYVWHIKYRLYESSLWESFWKAIWYSCTVASH
jgi:hypothetical protein